MTNQELLAHVHEAVYKDSKMISEIVLAIQYAAQQKIHDMNETMTKKDKAIIVLFEGHDFGSRQNLVDTAEQLTKNAFNGTEKKYTAEEVRSSFIKNL